MFEEIIVDPSFESADWTSLQPSIDHVSDVDALKTSDMSILQSRGQNTQPTFYNNKSGEITKMSSSSISSTNAYYLKNSISCPSDVAHNAHSRIIKPHLNSSSTGNSLNINTHNINNNTTTGINSASLSKSPVTPTSLVACPDDARAKDRSKKDSHNRSLSIYFE